jgi:hypothetical protein
LAAAIEEVREDGETNDRRWVSGAVRRWWCHLGHGRAVGEVEGGGAEAGEEDTGRSRRSGGR